MYILIVLGVIAVIMGVSLFLAPAFFAGISWRVFVKWKSYGAEEPSDEYILGCKVGGVVGVIGGIIMILLPFSSFLD
ncbi:MAG: hypothetical protein K1W26_03345 [Acetatifactor sp.]